MFIRKAALMGVVMTYAAPAAAEPFIETRSPRAVASFEVANQPVEILAVTRRARADTAFRQRYVAESEAMAKVYPGYPQPPILSFDVRVRF